MNDETNQRPRHARGDGSIEHRSSGLRAWWDWLRTRAHRWRKARRLGEGDAPGDLHTARSRPTGGTSDPQAPDTHSTTGTTPNEEFVGQASGDDPGGAEQTGAERRAEQDAESEPPRSTT